MKTLYTTLAFLLLFSGSIFAQTAYVRGVTFDEDNNVIGGVNVFYGDTGTQSDIDGYFSIEIPANEEVKLTFSYIGLKNVVINITLALNEDYKINPVLKSDIESIGTVFIDTKQRKRVEGITTISPEAIRKIPGANAGVENLLKSLPGVNNNNELSTQYAVRGGNFDENLVYVNEIEVYRPFLVRSGQQEGLSFVNSDLTRSVDFSAGGFQAKYGDKLSSVLDITYRNPSSFGATADFSFLGGSVSVEGASKDEKLKGIVGLRFRDNSLFVDSRQTEVNVRPKFADAQTYLSYKFSNKFELGFLGNIAINSYDFEPLTRQTNFGTLADPRSLIVNFEGQEEDRYETYFGALKGTYVVNENFTTKLISSIFQTQEQEHFDILARYSLGRPNTNIGDTDVGEVEFSEGAGSQFIHARNDLDALIFNLENKGTITAGDNTIEYGVKYTHEDIRDRVEEFEIIDSAGFSVRPPLPDFVNDQPFTPFDAAIVPFTEIRAQNNAQINRLSGFVQWSKRTEWGNSDVWLNAGARAHNWTVSGEDIETVNQIVFSPRAQLTIKPKWEKDMLFRLSGGVYHQPPFYREIRDLTGTVVPDVKAQKSVHIVVGNDYSFKLWNRSFTLNSEAFYKDLTNVNTYTLDNVRIRYRANNDATAFAYGLDVRLAGEFVPGTESWVSFGYLKTEENQDNRGFISRPTDQRLKFAVLVQDYVKVIPNLKGYLNLTYNSGLPGGSPAFADPFDFQSRLPDYTRTDLGVSYVLVDSENRKDHGFLSKFRELSIGAEIFNIFDVRNSITNSFVRDVNTQQQFAIPNFLTPRVFNLRTTMKF